MVDLGAQLSLLELHLKVRNLRLLVAQEAHHLHEDGLAGVLL